MILTPESLAAIKKRHEACAFEAGFRWHHEGAEQVHQDRAALLAHIESTPAPQWRPISEAPKDGTRVMLFYPSTGDGRWTGLFQGEKWFTVNGIQPVEPTHFQPLPAPPAMTDAEGEK